MPLNKSLLASAVRIDETRLSESEVKLVPHFVRPGADGLVSGANFVAWESAKIYGRGGKKLSLSTRQFYLMTGCKLARLAGLDMIDIANRLAEVRQTIKETNAAANPRPAKTNILDRVDHWPEPYRGAFQRMVWASRADDDALAEYFLQTGTVPLKRLEGKPPQVDPVRR